MFGSRSVGKKENSKLLLNSQFFWGWSSILYLIRNINNVAELFQVISKSFRSHLKCCCFQNIWLEWTARSLIKVSFCSSFVNILGDYADSIFNISEHLSALLVEFLQHKPPLLSSLELTLFTGNWGILAKKTALTEPTECSYSTSWIFFSNMLHIFEVYNFYAFWILWI